MINASSKIGNVDFVVSMIIEWAWYRCQLCGLNLGIPALAFRQLHIALLAQAAGLRRVRT